MSVLRRAEAWQSLPGPHRLYLLQGGQWQPLVLCQLPADPEGPFAAPVSILFHCTGIAKAPELLYQVVTAQTPLSCVCVSYHRFFLELSELGSGAQVC